MKKVYVLIILSTMSWAMLAGFAAQEAKAQQCLSCHELSTPGIAKQWRDSKHSDNGVNCEACHTARQGDPSSYFHYGSTITGIPSPQYCKDCHPKPVE
jgi:hypothetical protein